MRIKAIVSGVAVALAVSVGSASAADQFSTLDGIAVEPMNAVELDRVRGMDVNVGGVLVGITSVADVVTDRVSQKTAGIMIEVDPPTPPTP